MKIKFKKLTDNAVAPSKAHPTDVETIIESHITIINTFNENGRKFYICKCNNCGFEKKIRSDNLKKYRCPSCTIRKDHKPMIGKRFGHLVIKQFVGRKNGRLMWLCKCDCGKEIICNGYNLRRGQKSCGCIKKGKISYLKHGLRYTRLYEIWSGIKKRCYNKKCIGYNNYGGRGIKMCDEWLDSPSAFYKWAINNGYEENLTIERKDYNKDYSPENCTWIPRTQQSKNQRSNIVFYQNNVRYILSDIAKRHNLNYELLYQHYYRTKEINKYLKQKGILENYEHKI